MRRQRVAVLVVCAVEGEQQRATVRRLFLHELREPRDVLLISFVEVGDARRCEVDGELHVLHRVQHRLESFPDFAAAVAAPQADDVHVRIEHPLRIAALPCVGDQRLRFVRQWFRRCRLTRDASGAVTEPAEERGSRGEHDELSTGDAGHALSGEAARARGR